MLPRLLKNDYIFSLLILTLLAVIFFLPVIIGTQSLFEAYPVLYNSKNFIPPQIKTPWVIDGGTHVRTLAPNTIFGVETLKEGTVPLWNPYDGTGEASMTNNSYLYNPIRAIFFSIFSGIRAFDFYFVLRFLIAGFGMFIFLKEIRLSRNAALLGSISYMFSGYFITFITYPFLDIDAYLPYILFAFEKYFKTPNLKLIILSGFLTSLTILGGHPQVTIIAGLFFGGYFLWRVFSQKELREKWKTHTRNLFLIIATATAVALPYIADFLNNFSQGFNLYSPNVNEYLATEFGTHGLEHSPLIYLLHFFVNPSTFLEAAIGGHLFNRFFHIVPYVSVVVLLLVFSSFFIKPKPKLLYFFYIFGGFAILKLIGFPLINWIGLLPILDKIGWHKMHGPLTLSFCTVAALSIHSFSKGIFRRKKFLVLLSFISIAFLFAAAFFPSTLLRSYTPNFDFLNRRPETIASVSRILEQAPDVVGSALMNFLTNGQYFVYFLFARTALLAAVTLLLILWVVKSKSRLAMTFLILFMILELFMYMPKVRDGFRYFNPYIKPPFVEFLQAKTKENHFGVMATDYTFPVSLGTLYGVRRVQTTSAVFPKRFWHFVPGTIRKHDNDYFKLEPQDITNTPPQFFDAANLKYLVTESEIIESSTFSELVYDNDLKIYENKNVLPRAYLVFNKETASSPENARALFYAEEFNPHSSVILEDKNNIKLNVTSENPAAQTSILSYKPNEVVISTNSDHEGVLVLTDTYFKGWNAYVDDIKTKTYPANILFRGVHVPSGSHTIRFAYEPSWFWPSIIVSLTTILLGLGAIIRRK